MTNLIRSNNKRSDLSLIGLQKTIDDMFNSFFTPSVYDFARNRDILPACDFYETDKDYCFSFDLPGITKEDIDISISGDNLVVKGGKKSEAESCDKDKKYYFSERYHGSFYRSVQLPDDADKDKISADFANGVLSITIPKSEKKMKKIEIK
ncbi:Hsp20/alpha crystallin family protein [Wolbachia endosymbiont (group A) of Udea olivalis]|uniref:Hsp20/alpha crystallin family protein n=1 Tax=Wolbachia endosymbiont (group A) of Udea olivalis TaxID=3066183 RepID=UPI003132F2B4